MLNINDFIRSKPRGFRKPWAEKNHMHISVLDNWQKKENFFIHDGYVYKRVRRIEIEK